MRLHRIVFIILIAIILFSFGCRTRNTEAVTIALDAKFSSLDPLGGATVDANAERMRNLMFNTLVKKDEKFNYVGELGDISELDSGSTISFALKPNVKFHNGKTLTSADVKYTFDQLFKSSGAKASAFFETINGEKKPHILAIETPDEKTVNFKLSRPALKNQLLSNLVAIPIIAEGSYVPSQPTNAENNVQNNSAGNQNTPPVGSGPFKFVKFDTAQNIVELTANLDYWEGAPQVQQLRVKTVSDSNSVQAELRSQNVDIAPMMNNLSPDTIKSLETDPNLKVQKFSGANVQLITFNTQSKPLDNVKARQAIAYAIDREKIINELLGGQAKIAHSIIPEESWAYSTGTTYLHDITKAKQLLDEAGLKADANGNRLPQPLKFKIVAGNAAMSQYAQVIQSQLKEVGIPVEIETAELGTLLSQLQNGQFQMTMTRWVGGNQDPIFFRDLFASSEIPNEKRASRNRSRYSNPTLDKALDQALSEPDRAKAKEYYAQVQNIVSRELPAFPLWYPANVVVFNKRIGGIQVNGSGDWTFVRNITVAK